ncbi:hypothetical protein K502DRAFT_341516 [Neoconidiobolus thromboides FSU 785]|nr:hypothetical protein K502DRAFT_341516 [Neoconidiobolus thromboides FSU 785]
MKLVNKLIQNFQYQSIRSLHCKKYLINSSHLTDKSHPIYQNSHTDLAILLFSKSYQQVTKTYDYLQTKLNPSNIQATFVDNVIDNNLEEDNLVILLINKENENEVLIPFYHQDKDVKDLNFNSVGRWRVGKQTGSVERREMDLGNMKSISQAENKVKIPKELETVKESNGSLFLMGDNQLEQYLQVLDIEMKGVTKTGFKSSNTIFEYNTPNQLYYNNKLYQEGLLGFYTNCILPWKVSVDRLTKISDEYELKQCQGNIIIEFKGFNNACGLLKEKVDQLGNKNQKLDFNQVSIWTRLSREEKEIGYFAISAGDPSNGNIALDTKLDLKIGDKIEFYYEDNNTFIENRINNNSNELSINYLNFDLNYSISNESKKNSIINSEGLINFNNGISTILKLNYSKLNI